MNRELIQFIQRLGCSEVILRCDNEPVNSSAPASCNKDTAEYGFEDYYE